MTINCILGVLHPVPTLCLVSKFRSINQGVRRSSRRSTHTCKLSYSGSAAHGARRSQPFLEICRLTSFTHLLPSLLCTQSGCTLQNSADPHGLHPSRSCSNAISSNAELQRVRLVTQVGADLPGSQYLWEGLCKLGATGSYLGLYVGLGLTLAPDDK